MKIYLDDIRKSPDGWIQVRWPNEMIDFLKNGNITEISLDHDLGNDKKGTGYDVLLWIEEQVLINNFVPPKIHIHTSNTSAKIKMEQARKSIYDKHFKNLANNYSI